MIAFDRVKQLRSTIRTHRDQKADDRCWLDDYLLWKTLADSPAEPLALPSKDEMMKLCRNYYELRRADTLDEVPADAIVDAARWDNDLEAMGEVDLKVEIERLESAIRTHRNIGDRLRTIADDRALYAALPEKLPADFRLPPEDHFLVSQTPNSGCPNFWQSHQNCACKQHDLHKWGPCCS
jgi:hypothetical protein